MELAVIQDCETLARAMAVMPERESKDDPARVRLAGGLVEKQKIMKNVLHCRSMPRGVRSALRREPKHLLE